MSNDTTLTVVGNLTADPELAFTPSGTAYARVTIASTPRRYDKQTGDWVDGETLFLRATCWRDLADHAAESLHKGQRVIATGRLRQSTWETDTGEKRTAVDLDIDEVGPSLRWATARVTRIARDSDRSAPGDPWSNPPATPHRTEDPAAGTAARIGVPGFPDHVGADEPPF